jgi:hypothetical protein
VSALRNSSSKHSTIGPRRRSATPKSTDVCNGNDEEVCDLPTVAQTRWRLMRRQSAHGVSQLRPRAPTPRLSSNTRQNRPGNQCFVSAPTFEPERPQATVPRVLARGNSRTTSAVLKSRERESFAIKKQEPVPLCQHTSSSPSGNSLPRCFPTNEWIISRWAVTAIYVS